MDKSVFFDTDCDSILSQIKHQEKQLKLERRWLLGLSTSKSEHNPLGRPEFLKFGFLAESLLREDDMFYETIKSRIEEAFGICEDEERCKSVGDSERLSGTLDPVRVLDMQLDALTNKGLYLITMIVTGDSVKFEKTRHKMKKIIRDYVAKGLGNYGKREVLGQLHGVLNDPRNFRGNCVTNLSPSIQSHCDAAGKILDELENLSFQTLVAMERKLKCVRSIPQLKSSKSRQSRSHLIKQVRTACENMLSEVGEEDELQEPLAKAMALADLSFKLNPGNQNFSAGDFYQFSPEVRNLQNEMVKAIWILKTKVRFPELKTIQLLLDPEADIPNDCLRKAVKKMLIEYLFECSDMDTIPESLLQVLAVVNRRSQSVEHKVFPKEAVEEEVECILSFSAQMKQNFWLCFPDSEIDQDFTDAYMEELEDSDDGNSIDDEFGEEDDNCCQKLEVRNTQDGTSDSFGSDHEESIGECMPFESRAAICATSESASHITINGRVTRDITEVHSTPTVKESRSLSGRNNIAANKSQVKVLRDEAGESIGLDSENQSASRTCLSIEYTKLDCNEQKMCRNQNWYLAVQEACDETSMVAYNLIGHLLEKFADEKGLELDWDDRSYLVGNSVLQEDKSVKEDQQTSSEEKSGRSIIIEVVKELMPCLQKSVLARLEELVDVF